MSSRFNLLFYLKKPKNYKGGPMPIYMRVGIAGQRTEFTTQRECDPQKWKVSAGRASGTKEQAKELNAYLDTLQGKVYQAQRKLVESDRPVTISNIRELLTRCAPQAKKLLEIFQYHNAQIKELVNIEYAPGTYDRYQTALLHIKSFIKSKYGLDDIPIEKLSYQFVTDLEFWFKTVRKCCHNTTVKYISNLKKIIILCIKNGWLHRDPFVGYRLSSREVIREYLTENEVEVVYRKNFPTERLNLVRDIFVFSCYTGLSYADIKKLKRSEIIIGIDGEKWISIQRQKTDSLSRIPLLPIAIEILESYKAHPRCLHAGLLLPILSNQKMNSYLKEIADVSGIQKNFTFHCARHTFATTITLTNGVPIESVSKMLGHKNLKTTQHYARILDKKVSEDMKSLKERFDRRSAKNKDSINCAIAGPE